WPHERALGLLREGAGTQFDASCVDALERVLSRERGAELALAVSTCLGLVAQVREVGLRVDRPADRSLDRLRRRQLAAERVDRVAEPSVQLGELAALDLLPERRNCDA